MTPENAPLVTAADSRLFDEGEALFELNPARLQTYLDCPKQYRFRYVDHRTERRSFPQTALGRSVHRALRDFYALTPRERTLPTLLQQLRHAWDPSGFRTAAQGEVGFLKAEDMLRRYFDLEDHASVRAIALESKFHLQRPGAGVYVWGRIDRLDAQGDDYVIVDYKTGSFRQDQKSIDDSLPLSLYAMAVSEQFRQRVSRIVLYHLASGQRVETKRDTARLEQDWNELERIAGRMRTEVEYEASPGSLCRWCDFVSICPEGRAEVGPFELPVSTVRRTRRAAPARTGPHGSADARLWPPAGHGV